MSLAFCKLLFRQVLHGFEQKSSNPSNHLMVERLAIQPQNCNWRMKTGGTNDLKSTISTGEGIR
jgi:hypothetical protein